MKFLIILVLIIVAAWARPTHKLQARDVLGPDAMDSEDIMNLIDLRRYKKMKSHQLSSRPHRGVGTKKNYSLKKRHDNSNFGSDMSNIIPRNKKPRGHSSRRGSNSSSRYYDTK